MADQLLDTKGLSCPLPVLKAKKALKELPKGSVLRVLATDPGAARDFPQFCEATGHKLIAHEIENGVHAFDIEVAT